MWSRWSGGMFLGNRNNPLACMGFLIDLGDRFL
jgi:hypothetical protein